ncbi:MAG: primary-amine oxidase [Elusimicrobia bacterium]|nr:primary-amine oxidase [Elusimicrobiota bacterium]
MRRLVLAGALLVQACAAGAAVVSTFNPLDPLSPAEIATTVKVLRDSGLFSSDALFPLIVLQEPPKAEVVIRAWMSPRRAFAVIIDRHRNETSEAVVNLADRTMESWRIMPEVQANFLVEELTSAPEIVRADPQWQEAMKRRGITDFSEVQIDGWAPGTLGVSDASGPRLVRALSFYKGKSVNFYARPVEGVVALVDMNQRKVVDLVDTGVVPLSQDDGAFDEKSVSPREAPKPFETLQSEGPSFTVSGHEVRWQNWRFRFALHPREGLVLYTVGYEGEDQVRPILYRASLSEMVVPYGDPDPNWAWRSAFDEGEYGIGRLAGPFEPGVDAPENAVFFDADFADDFGKSNKIARAVALYERDGGLLWKHFTIDPEHNESRRARELVLKSMAAVGNYDYAFSWIFRQDGSLEMQIELTGIMLAKGVAVSSATARHDFAHRVSQAVAAPHHQHFFNFRLDFDVDGASNTVVESNTRSLPGGASNPYGNGIEVELTPLKNTKEARRDVSPASSRRWIVQNTGVMNALGEPVGYALIPGETAVPYARPESKIRKRAGFLNHQLWVTPYAREQAYAAGDYPNQSDRGTGLEPWTREADPVEDQDLVVWYTMGVTHLPRPEDWPVMPVTRAGFKLVPMGFFSRNPALDVPRRAALKQGKKTKAKPQKKWLPEPNPESRPNAP